jgi:hypothetical protein
MAALALQAAIAALHAPNHLRAIVHAARVQGLCVVGAVEGLHPGVEVLLVVASMLLGDLLPLFLALLQSQSKSLRHGPVARGPTAEEFRDFIKAVLTGWYAYVLQHATMLAAWCRLLRRPTIHGHMRAGDWSDLLIDPSYHNNLPAYSPDMHYAIELVHAEIAGRLQNFINAET